MSSVARSNLFSKPVDVRATLETPPPILDHVLPGLLAGTTAVMAASGGIGKTMLLLQTGCAVATGTSLCGGLFEDVPPECARSMTPGKVVMVAAEESCDLLAHRLHAAVSAIFLADGKSTSGAHRRRQLELLHEHLLIFPLLGQSGMALLNSRLEPTDTYQDLRVACESARLVLLDPLRQFHQGDENSSLDMNAMVQLLQRLASQTAAAVIVSHHTNRASTNQGTAELAGAARGSTALTDGVRWQLNLSRPTELFLKQYGQEPESASRFVRLDVAKANYLAPYGSRLLVRTQGGALSLVHHNKRAASSSLRTPGVRSRGRRPVDGHHPLAEAA